MTNAGGRDEDDIRMGDLEDEFRVVQDQMSRFPVIKVTKGRNHTDAAS